MTTSDWINLVTAIATSIAALAALGALWQISIAAKGLNLSSKALEASIAQLRLTERDIKLRCQREAGTLAAQLTAEFGQEIVPLFDAVQFIHQMVPKGTPKNFLRDEVDQNDPWVIESKKHSKPLLLLANRMEGIAIYFDKALADEEVAFQAVAPTFIQYVERAWPFISWFRSDESVQYYQSTVNIFRRWKAKLEKQRLEISSRKSLEQLNAIPAVLPKIPIGAKLN